MLLPAAATPWRTTLTGAMALRAAASAAKLAIDPPLTNRPAAAAGYPSISFSQSMARCSRSVPDGADRQHVTLMFSAAATRAPMADTGVPGDET